MKPSEVYRKAAMTLEKTPLRCYGWSCWAIEDVLNVPCHDYKTLDHNKHELVRNYEAMFRPQRKLDEHTKGAWGLEWGEDANSCRILALCFMAAITGSK